METESRELFKELMLDLKLQIAESYTANSVNEAMIYAEKIGFPISIRPTLTMGGTGGGFAEDIEEFDEKVRTALDLSPANEVLIEKSLKGTVELEYEMIRDHQGTVLNLAQLENIDPVGIHTGDSMVVAPILSLDNKTVQEMRDICCQILNATNMVGGCNVQLSYDPVDDKIYVIEINPRLSRSSALASKSVAYPIAQISTLVYLGYPLSELLNLTTHDSSAAFEPSIDYIVTKLPKFAFDKFTNLSEDLGFQMKATGEAYSFGESFEISFLRALNSLYFNLDDSLLKKYKYFSDQRILEQLGKYGYDRIFLIFEAFKRNISFEQIKSQTKMRDYFLNKFKNISLNYKSLMKQSNQMTNLQMLDSCSGEIDSKTNTYFYTEDRDEAPQIPTGKKSYLIIGPGPIKIGQGIEFDFACTKLIQQLRKMGHHTIVMNNNPSTNSTDLEVADTLIVAPYSRETIVTAYKKFNCEGIFLTYGGQTAFNCYQFIKNDNLNIVDISPDTLNITENRDAFYEWCMQEDIKVPRSKYILKKERLKDIDLDFPVILRPSFVTGGEGMIVFSSPEELNKYCTQNKSIFPIYVDEFITGIEFECDAICDGKEALTPFFMEHLDPPGVHSGDSNVVFPSISLKNSAKERLQNLINHITQNLGHKGLINFQFVYHQEEFYLIEVNVRASRSLPLYEKSIKGSLINLSLDVLLNNHSIQEINTQDLKNIYKYNLKLPFYSTKKLSGILALVGANMQSTGEVIAQSDQSLMETFRKGLEMTHHTPSSNQKTIIVYDETEKDELIQKESMEKLTEFFTFIELKDLTYSLFDQTDLNVYFTLSHWNKCLYRGIFKPEKLKQLRKLIGDQNNIISSPGLLRILFTTMNKNISENEASYAI
ncbi:ATP-grasp domain-containing protein [Bacteriovoracaceae bacterium]|nr:ATP-grasp domain-containing protein [Bacteriovoracaceae bacterium]